MTTQTTTLIQAEITTLTLLEFTEVSGLTHIQIQELVETGVLNPTGQDASGWLFNQQAMSLAQRLRRIQTDLELDLDPHALALGFRLLERITELETLLSQERASRRDAGES